MKVFWPGVENEKGNITKFMQTVHVNAKVRKSRKNL